MRLCSLGCLFNLSSSGSGVSSSAVSDNGVNLDNGNLFYNCGVNSCAVGLGLLVVTAAGEHGYAESNSEEKN